MFLGESLAASIKGEVQVSGLVTEPALLLADLVKRKSQQAYLTEVALMGRKWLRILQRSKRPSEEMEEDGTEELRRRAQEAISGKLREVAAQDSEEVRKAREERWEMSTDLAKLMKAAYTLYPAAASISRFRGEAQWRRTDLRGGDRGFCCQGKDDLTSKGGE